MSDEPPDAAELTVIVDDERAESPVVGSVVGCRVDVSACQALVADVLDHEGLRGRRLEVHVHGARDVLASARLREEGVEGVVTAADGLGTRNLPVRLDPMLQAEELPT